jgi:hypothetical protein
MTKHLTRSVVFCVAALLCSSLYASVGGPAKPFADKKQPETRHTLLDAWKAQHHHADTSTKGIHTNAIAPVTPGAGEPIVGRASMVIKSNGDVVYTKNFLGYTYNCDVYYIDDNAGRWHASSVYASGDQIESGGKNFIASIGGTTGGSLPVFNSTTYGDITTDGTVTWRYVPTNWVASQAIIAGTTVHPTSRHGFNYRTSAGGTTAASEPDWPDYPGGSVNDGSVVWTAVGFGQGVFSGCKPLTMILRAFGGSETDIAKEGDPLPNNRSLGGWGEMIAMNSSNKVAFRAAVSGSIDEGDEGGSGIFTAGPAASSSALVAEAGERNGSRYVCGFQTLVAINDAGNVLYDAVAESDPLTLWQPAHDYAVGEFVIPTVGPNYVVYEVTTDGGSSSGSEPLWPTRPNNTIVDGGITWTAREPDCNEDAHGLVRFTPPSTKTLLLAVGSSIATSTVTEFGGDGTYYDQIDGIINSLGHVPVVAKLANSKQVVYNLTGAATGTQVAITGATYTSFSPRVMNNDSDQVVFKGISTAIDRIFIFTPPSTTATVVSVGDDLGTRSGGSASGVTFATLGNFFDVNNDGDIVFQADDSSLKEGYYYWDHTNGHITQIYSQTDADELASELISISDAGVVAYVTKSTHTDQDDDHENWEDGGLYTWTPGGGSVKMIAVGDSAAGSTVSTIYAQHHSFVRRQLAENGCVATAFNVGGDDPGFDCDEGNDTGGGCGSDPLEYGGQLYVSCAAVTCPTITVTPNTESNGVQGNAYTGTAVGASGGSGPYTFTITLGSLPPGVNLSSAGAFSGTPTAGGTFSFTVTATDNNGCTGTHDYTINITGVGGPTIPTYSPFTFLLLGLALMTVGAFIKR